MMRIAKVFLVCVLLAASPGYGAEPGAPVSASALAELMKQAMHSEGFEARLSIFITKANGAHPPPFKLAVIGQFVAGKQRLLIRGISPESVHDRFIAAERGSDGLIRARAYRGQAASEPVELDPFSKIFDSGLTVWDMFGLWWSWPKQSLEGIERINGRECTRIRSITDDKSIAVREVESCVDQQAKISLRTKLFDSKHALIRATSVEKVVRKRKGGGMAAKKLSITDAGGVLTDVEVYAGDEQYEISADTFSALDLPTRNDSQETK